MNFLVRIYLVFSLFLPLIAAAQPTSEEDVNSELAQRQLDAYNARDIESFLACFSDSVRVYNFPDEFRYQGKEGMRRRYGKMFENAPNLHCELANRITMRNRVIDREKVKGLPNREGILDAVAIYEMENGLITKVWFMIR